MDDGEAVPALGRQGLIGFLNDDRGKWFSKDTLDGQPIVVHEISRVGHARNRDHLNRSG